MANDIRIKLSADGTQVKNELKLIDKELQELGKHHTTTANSIQQTSIHNTTQSQQSSSDHTNQNVQLRAQTLLIKELKSLRQEMSKLGDTYAKSNTNKSPSTNTNNNSNDSGRNNTPTNNNTNDRDTNRNTPTPSTKTGMENFNLQVTKLQSVLKNINNAYNKVRSLEASASLDLQRQRMAYSTYGTVSTENNYSRLSRMATSQGREYGYNYQQYLPAAGALIQSSGYNAVTHQQDMNAILRVSRGTGLDPTRMASLAGSMISTGASQQGQMQKFANMIGVSISQNGMQGRESEQIKVLEGIHNTLAQNNATVSEKTFAQGMGLYNALVAGNSNLKGERGGNIAERMANIGSNYNMGLYYHTGGAGGISNRIEWEREAARNPMGLIDKSFKHAIQRIAGDTPISQMSQQTKDLITGALKSGDLSSLNLNVTQFDAIWEAMSNGSWDKELEKTKNPNYQAGDNYLQRITDNYKNSNLNSATQTQYSMREGEAQFSSMSSTALGLVPDSVASTLGASSGLTGVVSGALGSAIPTFLMSRYLGSTGGGTGAGGLGGIWDSIKGLGRAGAGTARTIGTGVVGKGLGVAGGLLGAYGAYESAKEGDTLSAALQGGLSGASLGATIGSIIPGVGTLAGAGIGGALGLVTGGIGSLFGKDESGVAHAATAPQDKTLSATLLQDENKERMDKSDRTTEANTQAIIDNTNALRGNRTNTRLVDDTPTSAKKSQEDEKNKTLVDILRGNIPSKSGGSRGGTWAAPSSAAAYTGSMGSGGVSTGKAAYSQGKPIEGINAYNQWDDQWGDIVPTGWSGTLGSVGCTITAAAMMHELYTGQTLTPAELAQDSNRPGSIADMLRYVGVQGKYIQNGGRDTEEEVWASLAAGRPVQGYYVNASTGNGVNMGSGTHAFVAIGLNEDGTVKVLDPNGGKVTNISKEALTNNHEGTLDWYIPNADQEAKGLKKAQSHAQGLEFVPRDDYPAQLHKGERVLTKHEAEEFRNLPGLVDIPDSMKITKDDGLYNAKMKHQLQKDYKEQSATTSSDPYFNAPRFDQGGTVGGANSKRSKKKTNKETENWVILDTGQIVDKKDWEDGKYPGTEITSNYDDRKHYSNYEEYSADIAKLSELSNKRDQNIINNPNATPEQIAAAQNRLDTSKKISDAKAFLQNYGKSSTTSQPIKKNWETDQPTTDKEWDEYAAHQDKNFGSYKKEREKAEKQQKKESKQPVRKESTNQPPIPKSYTPQSGAKEVFNPDGTLSHTESTTQNKPPMRAKLPGGGSISGGFVARNDGNTTTVGFGFGYQADPQQAAASQQRKDAYQQYLQKKSDQSRFNPKNKDPLVGAVTAAVNAPWKQAEHAMPRFNGKAMGNQMAQGMKLNKHAIIPKVSKHDFFKKSKDGSGYVMNPYGVQSGMQRFNTRRQQRALQAMTGASPVPGAGGRAGVPGGGIAGGQGFSMSGQVRTSSNPKDMNRELGSGVMGLGGALMSGVGGLFGSIGGLFGGGKKKDTVAGAAGTNRKTEHGGLAGLFERWGNTATDASKKERDKMTTLKGDDAGEGTKAPLPTEPSKLGTQIPEKDGLDKIKPIKKDKTGQHRGLIGRWRNTAEEHDGAMNSLFAGAAGATETLGNGIGGLFGKKKKKNPNAADLPMGLGGTDPFAELNKPSAVNAALTNATSKENANTEVAVKPEPAEVVIKDTSGKTVGSTVINWTAKKGSDQAKRHGDSKSVKNTTTVGTSGSM